MILNYILRKSEECNAVVAKDGTLTYPELLSVSSCIAKKVESLSIEKDDVVAIYLERNCAAYAAIVGLLLAGQPYTIIEKGNEYSSERSLQLRLQKINPKHILTAEYLLGELGQFRSISSVIDLKVDEVLLPEQGRIYSELAYVLYTSGSTGIPKGVMVTRDNVNHYVSSIIDTLKIETASNFAVVSSLSADLGNTSIFLALSTGGTLHILDDITRRDPTLFFNYLASENISFLKITPSHWQILFQHASPAIKHKVNLKYLMFGGEILSYEVSTAPLIHNMCEQIINHYGPTEATIGTAMNVLTLDNLKEFSNLKSIPIGYPIGEAKLYVENGKKTSKVNIEGELLIAGPGVAKGYINRKDLTKDAFTFNHYLGCVVYKTGDIVKVDEKGMFTYLGRKDRQVKINGYRVELEHIEHHLTQLPNVKDAHVVAFKEGRVEGLYAAVVTDNEDILHSDIKDQLRHSLPTYMIPKSLFLFDALPLNNNGKKDPKQILKVITESVDKQKFVAENDITKNKHNDIEKLIRDIWQSTLKRPVEKGSTNFFESGGDSVNAIQVVSEIQKLGYSLTTAQFLESPTIEYCLSCITSDNASQIRERESSLLSGPFLSPAQQWFFDQNFTDNNHWNQSVLLSSDTDIQESHLTLVAKDIVAIHPMLRARFEITKDGVQTIVRESVADVLSVSKCSAISWDEAQEHILQVSSALNRQINLETGNVFKMHLFKCKNFPDHIMFLGHHLVTDAVSWRLIVSECTDIYDTIASGYHQIIPRENHTLLNWAKRLGEFAKGFTDDLNYWDHHDPRLVPPLPLVEGINNESNAATLWFALSEDVTSKLSCLENVEQTIPLHSVVLAALNRALMEHYDMQRISVDIESYGRLSFDERIDISRAVGWFTSTFPLVFDRKQLSFTHYAHQINETLKSVPNLGLSYHYWQKFFQKTLHSQVCFNFLGDFDLKSSQSLPLRYSHFKGADCRGKPNDRIHDFKFSARTINGQLVVDLSYPTKKVPLEEAKNLVGRLIENLHQGSTSKYNLAQIYSSAHCTMGQMMHVPKFINLMPRQSDTPVVLITGATGYIGIHLLKQLLLEGNSRIVCLSREYPNQSLLERLDQKYRWYFDTGLSEIDKAKLLLVAGDVSKPKLGMREELFTELTAIVGTVYHLAADTRLFADGGDMFKQNVMSVNNIINFSKTGKKKTLHYMSTMAVSGINRSKKAIKFCENSLDIGQVFQNSYEENKYRAETKIHDFIQQGGDAYIYRVGNVSAHSVNGKFQQNASDSRFVQLLRAIVILGHIPDFTDEKIELTPVDFVVDKLFKLSKLSLPNRVFHLDDGDSYCYNDIFKILENMGYKLERAPFNKLKDTFDNLFHKQSYEEHEKLISLGEFWANREDRNVVNSYEKTHRILKKLYENVPSPPNNWLENFMRFLVTEGVI